MRGPPSAGIVTGTPPARTNPRGLDETPGCLLCQDQYLWGHHQCPLVGAARGLGEQVPDAWRNETLEASHGLAASLAFGLFAGEVRPGVGVDAPLNNRDAVKGSVQSAIPAAIEPVASSAPR